MREGEREAEGRGEGKRRGGERETEGRGEGSGVEWEGEGDVGEKGIKKCERHWRKK